MKKCGQEKLELPLLDENYLIKKRDSYKKTIFIMQ